MKIACISSAQRGETDRILSDIADRLQSSGLSLAGIVKQQNYSGSYENGCDMKVRVLPDGPVIKITQDLGAGSDACRLDPGAIADTVASVEKQAMEHADLFILNKFGPQECAGRGFVSAIGQALEHDVPVLVGVGRANISAFETFTGGLAEVLPADTSAILSWSQTFRPKASTKSSA